jgi:adenylylsulfate kinase
MVWAKDDSSSNPVFWQPSFLATQFSGNPVFWQPSFLATQFSGNPVFWQPGAGGLSRRANTVIFLFIGEIPPVPAGPSKVRPCGQCLVELMANPSQIVWHEHTVRRADRERQLGQRGVVVWFTGLSGCGKSTIANELDRQLNEIGRATMLLDGDNIRHGLCAPPERLALEHGEAFAARFGLGFGEVDREENIRRIGAVAALMAAAGLITLTAFVSPYRRDRDRVRRVVEQSGQVGDFVEVFVDTPLEVCEQRDPKGLYRKARAGEIKHFTGISDPYEPPARPELVIRGGDDRAPAAQASEVLEWLRKRAILANVPEAASPRPSRT